MFGSHCIPLHPVPQKLISSATFRFASRGPALAPSSPSFLVPRPQSSRVRASFEPSWFRLRTRFRSAVGFPPLRVGFSDAVAVDGPGSASVAGVIGVVSSFRRFRSRSGEAGDAECRS